MVYQIFKIWAQLAFSLYFRRIFISGSENIPKKGAVLILVNHPNSFLEPCVIAAFQHRNLHFLVRGDMFEKKWLKPILTSTNQIPIYRFKDGFEKLRSNKSTFDQAYKVLAEKHTLLMFPEASSELVKYLRPLQKGASRLALGAFEENNVDELIVIPTGIHYYNAPKSRNDVVLKFGEALSMKKWILDNTQTEDKLNALTAYFQNAMDKVIISINPERQESIYDDAYLLAENDQLKYSSSGVLKTEEGYAMMNKLITSLNQLSENAFKELGKMIIKYKGTYDDLKSFDSCVKLGVIEKIKILIYLLLSFIIGLPGFILYSPSFIFSKYFTKAKIKHITFYAPVRIAFNMGTHIFNSIILYFILIPFLSLGQFILLFVFLQISLYSFGIFMDFSRYAKYLFNLSILKKRKSLLVPRSEIINILTADGRRPTADSPKNTI